MLQMITCKWCTNEIRFFHRSKELVRTREDYVSDGKWSDHGETKHIRYRLNDHAVILAHIT